MNRRRTLALASMLFLAPTLSAHDTLPAAWCPVGTEPVIVGSFSFNEATLTSYRSLRLAAGGAVLGSDCDKDKTCGIIDEWYWANQLAHDTCGANPLKSGQGGEAAMPIVTAPDYFNANHDSDDDGIVDHHDKYRFWNGLQGACVVCRTPPRLPSESAVKTR